MENNHLYSLQGSTVLRGNRDIFSRDDAVEFPMLAVRRALRKREAFTNFVTALKAGENCSYAWNFLRWEKIDRYRVTIQAEQVGDGVRFGCTTATGEEAWFVIDRIANLARKKKRVRKVEDAKRRTERKRRSHLRRAKKKRARLLAALPQLTRQELKQKRRERGRRFAPAPLSLVHKERIVPQFRSNVFFWTEAVRATAMIFKVRNGLRSTGRQIVEVELFRSLERSGYRFAQFKRGGFILRFDVSSGVWKGDLTALSISATKDNGHPVYRRMRAYFRERLGPLTGEQRERRRILAASGPAILHAELRGWMPLVA